MENKILITGTSSGLGKKLTSHYLKKNFIVIGISRRKVKINSKKYYHYCADLSKNSIIKTTLKKIFNRHKKIDFLINNLAVNNSFGIISFMPNDKILDDIRVNIISNVFITKQVSQYMMREKFGRIVTISSVATKLLYKGDSIYASCKSFLETFTKILGKELISHGITCNSLSLSLFDGGLNKKISSKTLEVIRSKFKRERFVNLKEITNILDNKIFVKNKKYNSKIFNIF